MGMDDKAQEVKGRMKEATGAATDDDELRAEGQTDQTKGKAKQKVDDLAESVKHKLD